MKYLTYGLLCEIQFVNKVRLAVCEKRVGFCESTTLAPHFITNPTFSSQSDDGDAKHLPFYNFSMFVENLITPETTGLIVYKFRNN